MVWQAFEVRFSISYKQKQGLDRWSIDSPSRGNPKEEEEKDVTTGEGDIYSSGWSF